MRTLRRVGELAYKALRLLVTRGPGAAWRAAAHYCGTWIHHQWERDRRWQGRLLELMGNRRRIDGVLIDVSSPQIPTHLKGLFLKRNYEWAERRLVARHFSPDVPVIELGGSLGVVSCVTNLRMPNPERHLVIEANPALIPILERNRALNRCRFRVVNAALAYGKPEVTLYVKGFTSSNLFEAGEESVTVPAATLEALADEAGFERFNLICDVEGAELEMVEREGGFLRERADWMIIEMHDILFGLEAVGAADRRLQSLGFRLVEQLRNVHCYRNTRHIT